jgi:uncharacterized protein (TIGR02444 family)
VRDHERAAMSGTEAQNSQGSPLWRFSLRFYRQPKVADACIALQEEAGVDVNLLLFLLWHATLMHELSAGEVAALEGKIGPWRDATVIPLRTVRRALKAPPALVAGAGAELFRTRIKAVELEAERLQQEAMYELARASLLGRKALSSQDAARASVAAYEAMCRAPFPEPAVETLLAALAVLEAKLDESKEE